MFHAGDEVVCRDSTGATRLGIQKGCVYVVEDVLQDCYIRLKGVSALVKTWRFEVLQRSIMTRLDPTNGTRHPHKPR